MQLKYTIRNIITLKEKKLTYPGPYKIKSPNVRYEYYWMHDIHIDKYGAVIFSYLDRRGDFNIASCSYNTFKNALEGQWTSEIKLFNNFICFDFNKDDIYGHITFGYLSSEGNVVTLRMYQDSFYKNSKSIGLDAWYEEQIRNI